MECLVHPTLVFSTVSISFGQMSLLGGVIGGAEVTQTAAEVRSRGTGLTLSRNVVHRTQRHNGA